MKFFGLLLFALCLVGCDLPETSYSKIRKASAVVNEMTHVAEDWDLIPTYIPDGNGGTMVIWTPIHNPPRWYIKFVWTHGIMDVQVTEELYNTLHEGQDVVIEYREKYHTWNDGSKTIANRDLVYAYPGELPAEQP